MYDSKTKFADNFYICREEFSEDFTRGSHWIGFVCNKLNINKLNEFFELIENKLNLDVKTVFYPTNDKTAVIIELSPFWLQSNCRRGFLTLFLRGATFYKNDFNQAIESYNLTNDIKSAIEWFLRGNTKFTSRLRRYECYDGYYSCGVVEYFRNYNFKQKLVKP